MAYLTDSGDARTWDLTGYCVTQLVIDTASVRIDAWTLPASFEVRFGAPFDVRWSDGRVAILHPDRANELAPLLGFVGAHLASMTVTREGTLAVAFADGTRLAAASHPAFEAWEVRGFGALEGVGYISNPGGGSPWGG